MDRNNCFPLFFAVKEADCYKVYQNNIYQAFETLGFPANILWPVDEVSLGRLSKVDSVSAKKHHTFVRRWNSKWHKSCSWTYTNNQVELFIDGETRVIPVVNIDCDPGTLPFNSAAMNPTNSMKTKPSPFVPRFPVSCRAPTM